MEPIVPGRNLVLEADKTYPDGGSLLTPVRANLMPFLKNGVRGRAQRFNRVLSKRRIKIEPVFKEIKLTKRWARFGGTHAGSCLCAWS